MMGLNKIALTIVLLFFCAFTTFAQAQQSDSVLAKVGVLKKLLSQADTLTPAEAFGYSDEQSDSSFDINGQIIDQLLEVLSDSSIVKYNLDSLLRHEFLGITHSKDKRLWIFNWYENTGGSWRSNISLVYYKTKSNNPKNKLFLEECSNGAWFGEIYKLKSAESKDIYLCLGSAVTCNSCVVEMASIVELTRDSINFHYPAFIDNTNNLGSSSCYNLDAWSGNITKFEYNPVKQIISYEYETDDNTPIRIVEGKGSDTVKGTLRWDGKQFIETVKVEE